jgi:hypothetical protein
VQSRDSAQHHHQAGGQLAEPTADSDKADAESRSDEA